MGNKVKFGLKNVHVAPFETVEGEIVYETPYRVPGAVEITLDPRGDMIEFFADDMIYYAAPNNQGYDGTLSIALVPDQFAIDCLGEEEDEEDFVLTEKTTGKQKSFAIMFEFDGDVKGTRHVLYNCTANRPTVAGGTKTESTEPNPDELTFVASARQSDYAVKTKTTTKTPLDVYTNWYDAVYTKAIPGV